MKSRMSQDTESGGQSQEAADAQETTHTDSPDERALGSDELACRLAYECGWQLCEHAIRTLEAQRTRAVALLSVTLIAAGIAASAFSAGDIAKELGCIGGIGGILFAASSLAVAVSTAVVAWPVKTKMALGPKNIVRKPCRAPKPGPNALVGV